MYVLTCEDCNHFKNDCCEYGIDIDECEDAYDCGKFEYNGEL